MQQHSTNRFEVYQDAPNLWDKIKGFFGRASRLFTDEETRGRVFGPFARLLAPTSASTDDSIRAVITQVAVANALLAGLPGKLGVGVFVSLAMEVWMAWRIARHVGFKLDEPKDVLKYFVTAGAVVFTIFEGFHHLLGFVFSAASILPFINPLIPAELFVTDLVGVAFWVGFKEARETGSFTVPGRALLGVVAEAKSLWSYQWGKLKALLTRENLRQAAQRLRDWFTGEKIGGPALVRDEVFIAASLAAIETGNYESLEGPMGKEVIQSIRDLYPDLRDASIEEIAAHMSTYSEEQMPGVISAVKGRLFERLVVASENADGDAWVARLHDDMQHPSTDLVMTNDEAGESFALSLKATDNPAYIEHTLARYPDDPILTTSEMADDFADEDQVSTSGLSDQELTKATEANLAALQEDHPLTRLDGVKAIGAGAALSLAVSLWPFVAAYLRKRITKDQLQEVFLASLGPAGKQLSKRVVAEVALGPVYIWYALARMCFALTKAAGIE